MTRVRPREDITYLIEIHFDIEQIEADGQYKYKDVFNTVRNIFTDNGFGYFYGDESPLLVFARPETSYGDIALTMINMCDIDWFRRYVNGYYYYDFDEADSNGRCTPEDIFAEVDSCESVEK